jgi:hypothetical protein
MSAATISNGSAVPPAAADPWQMEVGSGGGQGDYVLCPAGNYPATIVGLFDVGFQDDTKSDGSPTQTRKLCVAFELAKKRPDGTPFVLAERYTWSMRDNSNFYGLVCNMTGAKFREGDKFDPRALVGQPCMVQVNNSQSKKDPSKTYHNIGGVAQFPEGLPAPTATIEPLVYSVHQGTEPPACRWMPYIYGESVHDMARNSAELRKLRAAPAAAGAEAKDDIPF